MCGIVCAFDLKQDSETLRPQILEMLKRVRHRGPDWSGIYNSKNAILGHERLAIVDPTSGKQPLYSEDGSIILAANGEIYNHLELRKKFKGKYQFRTESDCEVILALYKEKGADFVDDLNGIFAFAIYDSSNDSYFIARDHMGIIPLYMGWDKHGTFYVASELKALEGVCAKIELFPPGHYWKSGDKAPTQWYKRDWVDFEKVKSNPTSIEDLHDALSNAVHRQLMSDVPYGVLLSGGLDSSITSALAKKFSSKRVESEDTQDAWWPQLHSFSVGLEGSPDLAAAKKVSEHIGSIHHEVVFTIQEGLDAIRDVIYHLETYDITTVRASTPMFLMARSIKSHGIKMVLSGEGADELFGGYLYVLPQGSLRPRSFHKETVRKLDKLHQYDCLEGQQIIGRLGNRGDGYPSWIKNSSMSPCASTLQDKMINKERMEKWVVRKAFEDYLPESVAWRQKEQFSDGVGYSWIDTLKEVVEAAVTDEQMDNAHFRFPLQTPQNKEEFYYRTLSSKNTSPVMPRR